MERFCKINEDFIKQYTGSSECKVEDYITNDIKSYNDEGGQLIEKTLDECREKDSRIHFAHEKITIDMEEAREACVRVKARYFLNGYERAVLFGHEETYDHQFYYNVFMG